MTPLLGIDEAAEYLNIRARAAASHIRDGDIRHTRLGKHIRIRAEWLDEYVAARERPVVAPARYKL